jgi:hypothetical protein
MERASATLCGVHSTALKLLRLFAHPPALTTKPAKAKGYVSMAQLGVAWAALLSHALQIAHIMVYALMGRASAIRDGQARRALE